MLAYALVVATLCLLVCQQVNSWYCILSLPQTEARHSASPTAMGCEAPKTLRQNQPCFPSGAYLTNFGSSHAKMTNITNKADHGGLVISYSWDGMTQQALITEAFFRGTYVYVTGSQRVLRRSSEKDDK